MKQKTFPFTDDEILRWEQKRGTMPERLGADELPAPDPRKVQQIRDAYRRTMAAGAAVKVPS